MHDSTHAGSRGTMCLWLVKHTHTHTHTHTLLRLWRRVCRMYTPHEIGWSKCMCLCSVCVCVCVCVLKLRHAILRKSFNSFTNTLASVASTEICYSFENSNWIIRHTNNERSRRISTTTHFPSSPRIVLIPTTEGNQSTNAQTKKGTLLTEGKWYNLVHCVKGFRV